MAIRLTVNGNEVIITSPPDTPLLYVLRAPASMAAHWGPKVLRQSFTSVAKQG